MGDLDDLIAANLPAVLAVVGVWYAAVTLGLVGMFPKVGRPRWAALVPVYNLYVLVLDVAGLSRLWFALLVVPPFQLIAVFLVNFEVAKRFGRSEAFGLGLTVLGFVFYPVLGFGRAKYHG